MECPVCYENTINCTLVCGHQFCKSCVKTWYTKTWNTKDDDNNGCAGCPMCRRNVHYRRMPIKKWKKEAYEAKKAEVYQEAFESTLEDMMAPITFEIGDRTIELPMRNVPTDQLEYIERTYRAIKDECTPDEIDYLLFETLDYYSDRRAHLNKRTYSEMGHWYPPQKHRGGQMNNRRRY